MRMVPYQSGLQRRDLQLSLSLRDELQGLGTFRTNSDTEVIVHAYEQWGDEALLRLQRHVCVRAVG